MKRLHFVKNEETERKYSDLLWDAFAQGKAMGVTQLRELLLALLGLGEFSQKSAQARALLAPLVRNYECYCSDNPLSESAPSKPAAAYEDPFLQTVREYRANVEAIQERSFSPAESKRKRPDILLSPASASTAADPTAATTASLLLTKKEHVTSRIPYPRIECNKGPITIHANQVRYPNEEAAQQRSQYNKKAGTRTAGRGPTGHGPWKDAAPGSLPGRAARAPGQAICCPESYLSAYKLWGIELPPEATRRICEAVGSVVRCHGHN